MYFELNKNLNGWHVSPEIKLKKKTLNFKNKSVYMEWFI